MKKKQGRTSFSDELERKRAKAIFYTRLRRWTLLILLLISGSGGLYLYFAYFTKSPQLVETSAPHMVGMAQVVGEAGKVGFDYTRMIKLMREYSKLVVDEGAGSPWGVKPISQLHDLLQKLCQERESYSDHLELIRKSRFYVPTKKRQKASLHYLRSMEDAISNLQRIMQDYGPVSTGVLDLSDQSSKLPP